MDDRAKTLSALDAFIASQRALLARTHDDIERLRGLKGEVVRDPEAFFDSVDERLDSPSFRLSDAGDAYNLAFKHTIEWGAFTGCDPTPLLTLPSLSLPPRSPLRTQSTPLSPLQSLVKSARRTLIDPVLTLFPPPTPLSDSELAGLGGLPVNAEEEKRRREHEKIRELKRMVRAGGKGYSRGVSGRGGGLRVPKQAVFVREDVEDESVIQVDVDVDVGMDIDGGESATPTPATLPIPMVGGIKQEEPMDVIDTIPSPPPPPPPSKFRSRAKVPPSAPAPRTSSRRSTRTTAPPAASTTPVAASPAASTSASSRPAKRVKVKHECVEEEEEEEDDPATLYECADGAYGYRAHVNGVYGGKAPSSSSTPPLYNGGGGKSVDAVSIGKVGSSAPSSSRAGGSVGGKSLEALGLGPTSTSKGKTKGGLGGAASSGSTTHNGAAKDVPTKQTGKGKGTREKEDAKKEKKEKPRPETYKQAWSVEEQRLLEQLLEEIPEGEGFRWQKISRAMGGRRTPRQVASRVQKYFEKLKRFGVG